MAPRLALGFIVLNKHLAILVQWLVSYLYNMACLNKMYFMASLVFHFWVSPIPSEAQALTSLSNC